MGNSDWVRAGLAFAEGPDSPCPFCQKALQSELLAELNNFFDEEYEADIAEVASTENAYKTASDEVLSVVDAALASGSGYIDKEVLRPLSDRIRSLISLNRQHIARKRNEPSVPIALEAVAAPIADIAELIDKANKEIERHNALVENLAAERIKLISQIWKRLIEDKRETIQAYKAAERDLNKAVNGLKSSLERKREELCVAQSRLDNLEVRVTSVQPTITHINKLLTSFGFTSFKLAAIGDKKQYYRIVRRDGSDARSTLSEGERSFITFLYFYYLVQGSVTASGINDDRIVVIDDPVSSLDSEVLFVVSALIKRIFADAISGTGRVKQVFILTHNIYFYREVTYDPKRTKERLSHETFWVIRKGNDVSILEEHKENPIKTSYELLWAEIRNPNRSTLTIQNVLRRILEHYFKILGNMDKDAIISEFEGEDKQICASLFSWINDGSHNFGDDLYVAVDEGTVARFLEIFRKIFEVTKQTAHYEMMMGVPDSIANSPATALTAETQAKEAAQ